MPRLSEHFEADNTLHVLADGVWLGKEMRNVQHFLGFIRGLRSHCGY